MTIVRAAAIAVALLGLCGSASADPLGTWVTQGGKSHVKIAHCGGALCGTIVWLREPNDPETGKPKTDKNNADADKRSRPVLGVPIVLSMKPDSSDRWSGQVYNAEDGKTYNGNFTLAGANKAQLQGCIAILCKTKTWTRAR